MLKRTAGGGGPASERLPDPRERDNMMRKQLLAAAVVVVMAVSAVALLTDDSEADSTTNLVKIGDNWYSSLDEALTAAGSMSGEVTVEIYGKVEYSSSTPNLAGSYDSITFVGKVAEAEISLTKTGGSGYISGQPGNVKVNFEHLILSRPYGAWAGDAGHMSKYFTVYRTGDVSYTDCTFPDGACAANEKTSTRTSVSYTSCQFGGATGKYGLWIYANTDCSVDNCSFNGYRGVKMYSEGGSSHEGGADVFSSLTLKDTIFSSSVTEKPAIALTFGKSVTLENNTYPSKGMFELGVGSDANPNGTTIMSDVEDISCISDYSSDCGVLVDGKIYRSLNEADDSGAIESTSTISMMYDSDEEIDLPAGVTVNKNSHTMDSVTIAGQPIPDPEPEPTPVVPGTSDDDDDPPYIPSVVRKDSSDDKTKTYAVAAAAAAAAAILALLAMAISRGKF